MREMLRSRRQKMDNQGGETMNVSQIIVLPNIPSEWIDVIDYVCKVYRIRREFFIRQCIMRAIHGNDLSYIIEHKPPWEMMSQLLIQYPKRKKYARKAKKNN